MHGFYLEILDTDIFVIGVEWFDSATYTVREAAEKYATDTFGPVDIDRGDGDFVYTVRDLNNNPYGEVLAYVRLR